MKIESERMVKAHFNAVIEDMIKPVLAEVVGEALTVGVK